MDNILEQPPAKVMAHVAVLVAMLCFSGWHIVGSLAMQNGTDPFVFALYRELMASVYMFAYAKLSGFEINIDKSDWFRFAILGLFSFVNVVGAMLALQYISATRFSIFQPSIPCFATMISISIGLEQFTILKGLGIALAVGGAVITEAWKTSGSDNDETEGNVLLGTIIAVFQVLAMASLIVFSKPILHKYPSPVVTVVFYSIGSFYTLLLCAAWAYSFKPEYFYFDGDVLSWVALAYAATFATLYPYNAFSWAGKYLTPSAITVYNTFQPVGTIVLSLLILGSVLTLPEGLGAAMVIVGLLVTVYGQRFEKKLRSSSGSDMGDEEAAGGDKRNGDSAVEGSSGLDGSRSKRGDARKGSFSSNSPFGASTAATATFRCETEEPLLHNDTVGGSGGSSALEEGEDGSDHSLLTGRDCSIGGATDSKGWGRYFAMAQQSHSESGTEVAADTGHVSTGGGSYVAPAETTEANVDNLEDSEGEVDRRDRRTDPASRAGVLNPVRI